jgi:succinyl-CoA synthetase alpha subunit
LNAPHFHGKRRTVSASSLLTALGSDLGQIRQDDKLTWADLGRVLGKSEDQAAKYADGTAEMPVTAYLFGQHAWGTRLTGRVEALVSAARAPVHDHHVLPDLLGCAKGLADGLRDGSLSLRDIAANRSEIEEAITALQGLLEKLGEGVRT